MQIDKEKRNPSKNYISTFFWLGIILFFIIIICSFLPPTKYFVRYDNIITIIMVAITTAIITFNNDNSFSIRQCFILSGIYTLSVCLAEGIASLALAILCIISIIGLIVLGFYLTYRQDIITDFLTSAFSRFIYAFSTIWITNQLCLMIKELSSSINKIQIKQLAFKAIIFVLTGFSSILICNFIDSIAHNYITDSIFSISSNTKIIATKTGNIFLSNEPSIYNTYERRLTNIGKSLKHYGSFTILPDNKILFSGCKTFEHGITTSFKEATIFDLNKLEFRPTGNMNIAQWESATVLLPNNNVLFIDNNENNKRTELYNIKTGKFTFSGNNILPLSNPRIIVLNKRTAFVYGYMYNVGYKAELYDINSGKFYLPKNPSKSESSFTPIKLNNGKLLIIGTSGEDQNQKYITEIYNPASNSFSRTNGNSIIDRVKPDFELLADGKILIIGGDRNSLNKAELFDPKTETYTAAGQMSKRTQSDFGGYSSITLPNKKILFIGGSEGVGEGTNYVKTIEIYDPKTMKFKIIGNMRKRRDKPECVISNNKLYIIGGERDERPDTGITGEVLDLNKFK